MTRRNFAQTIKFVSETLITKIFFRVVTIWVMLILAAANPAAARRIGPPSAVVRADTRGLEKKTVLMARATWDTGWFQAEIFKQLLEELGYAVAEPKTQDNQDFYRLAAEGDIDLWPNGWFPLHNTFIEKGVYQDLIDKWFGASDKPQNYPQKGDGL
jgi:ABC-type proline/glycine betaine transport system substrate-binding protein